MGEVGIEMGKGMVIIGVGVGGVGYGGMEYGEKVGGWRMGVGVVRYEGKRVRGNG